MLITEQFPFKLKQHDVQEVDTVMTEAVEQLRSHVESDAESLRSSLSTDGDEALGRLEQACSKLQRHLDALNALATHCSDVNLSLIHI